MKQFWFLTILTVILAFALNVWAEEEVVDKQVPSALFDLDADVKDDGDGVRETRQFGFYGPRPFYGGGFYGPRPYYGGGFYRPRPFYGGFYGPRPFYGGGFYG